MRSIWPCCTMTRLFSVLALCTVAPALSSLAAAARLQRITGKPENKIADAVLGQLLSTPLGATAPRLHYQVELVKSNIANAYSFPSGEILITSGLFWVLKDQQGVWAAAIGHELGHRIAESPESLAQFHTALRRDYERAAGGHGTFSAVEGDANLRLIDSLTAVKDLHGEESAADFIGLILMAEAGYQPGFAVVLDQRMRAGLGDASGLTAALRRHPRWSDRVRSTRQSDRIAMALFRSHWPEASNSPGGGPPAYGVIRRLDASGQGGAEAQGPVTITVSVDVYNTQGRNIRVAAEFSDAKLKILHATPSAHSPGGPLVLNSTLNPSADGAATVKLTLIPHTLATAEERVTGIVFLMSGTEVLDIANVTVKVPQN